MLDRLTAAEALDVPDHVVERAKAQFGHDPPGLLGHEGEEPHHVLDLAGEPLAEVLVLGGDSGRAGAQVALAHQQAAERDQGRGAEAEAFGPQQGGDDHVAAGLQLAVDLDEDAVAQAVEDEGLLGLGQAEFPGAAGMLDRRQRAGAGAAVMAADEDFVGMTLGHAGGHRADAHFGNQLHRNLARRGWRISSRK